MSTEINNMEINNLLRRQLKNEKTAQHQRRNQNHLLANNAHATYVLAWKTAKLSEAVGKLRNEISKQSRILESIEDTQSEILDETRKQTQLLELDISRKFIEGAAKQAVFELKVQVEEIEKLDTNLEKYFTSNACISSVNNNDINYEDLPSIGDKEYFYSATKKLRTVSAEALENLSDDESLDLCKIDDLRQKIAMLDKVEEESENVKLLINEINKTSSDHIAEKYDLRQKSQRKITYGKTIVSTLIGMWLVASTDESSSNYHLIMLFGSLFFFGGILGFAWRLFSEIFSSSVSFVYGMGFVDGSSEELYQKVVGKKESLVNEIRQKFDKEFAKVNFGISEKITLDNVDKISKEVLVSIQSESQALMQKYPALRFELKQAGRHT